MLPRIEREDVLPVGKAADPLPRGAGAIVAGVPEEFAGKRKVRILQPAPNAMSSGAHAFKAWRMQVAEREGRWVNSLMGWASSGDPLGVTGLVKLRFDTKEEAVAYAEKMGWPYEVEPAPPKKSFEGEKSYDRNFLNYHAKARIDRQPPGVTSRTQYAHPERGSATYMNLGGLAAAAGTSTHEPSATVEGVSQAWWNEPAAAVSKHSAHNWRTDAPGKPAELARKLGK